MTVPSFPVAITTDHSVDCSSRESIVRDVCRSAHTDQEKAVALFDFVRRLMFHYPNRPARRDIHDSLHLLNTYGYSFCSQQALLLVDLWHAAGIDGEVWAVPGHSTAQATYDGGLHWFDPLIGIYVLRRDGESVASLGEIAADPTILTRAPAEGRGCPGMACCGTVLKDDAAMFSKHDPAYVKECADLIDDVGFMAARAKEAKPWQWGDPPVSAYQPHLTVRPGEEITYLWDSIPGQTFCNVLQPGEEHRANWVSPDQLPPHHICGEQAEQRDPNWRFWQPYVRQVREVRTGRWAANGYQVYRPRTEELRADGAASVSVHLRTPHVYTGGRLTLDLERATDRDAIQVRVHDLDTPEGRRANDARGAVVWNTEDGRTPVGRGSVTVRLDTAIRGMRNVRLTIEHTAGSGAQQVWLHGASIEAVFQHNMYARAYLVPGENQVTVRADGAFAEGRVLTVQYAWEERGMRVDHERRITRVPQTYSIHVGGSDMPRMLSLRVAMER